MLFPDGVLTKHEDEEKDGEVLSDMAAILACCPGLLGMLPQQKQNIEETPVTQEQTQIISIGENILPAAAAPAGETDGGSVKTALTAADETTQEHTAKMRFDASENPITQTQAKESSGQATTTQETQTTQTLQATQTTQTPQIKAAFQAAGAQPKGNEKIPTAHTEKAQPAPDGNMQVESARQNLSPQNETGGDTDAHRQFYHSVQEAKKLIQSEKTQAKENPAEPVDIQKLQRLADEGKFQPILTAKSAVSQGADLDSIISQLKPEFDGMSTKGKNEFVVKLKPEGLGDITVKMVETQGRIGLHITATDPQVAKLLAQGAGQLRETLRPYHADIQEILHEQTFAQQQDFAQNFSGQPFEKGHERHSFAARSEAVHEAEEQAPARHYTAGFDTHI
jgi:flagellar hook-length control protein FliK